MVRLSEESITLMTPYRLIQGSWSRPSEGAVAHVVRLRILACRNDLNRKRIVSLQLTADNFYLLTAFLTTVIDPSHSLRMTLNALLIMTPYHGCYTLSAGLKVVRIPAVPSV